ncbi:hypothetical protein IPM62_01280 [Candidatus Woesebacteria bacterium]|nr:MAG: hypothetical protein IPM62_01280 [Candidatus Woesebacteria bacterium]
MNLKSINNTSIEEIGIKAYSLVYLKDIGLMENNLYVSSVLPEKSIFIKQLTEIGFKDKKLISARTSHPQKDVKLPRKPCATFDEAYDFYKENLEAGMVIVMHDFFKAKFGGIISYSKGEIVLEISESDWNIDYVLNSDMAVFSHGFATWYLYKDVRKIASIVDGVENYININPLNEKIAQQITDAFTPKLAKLEKILSGDFNSLEILISDRFKIFPLQLAGVKNIKNGNYENNNLQNDIFEIKTPHDLVKWDKKTPLLISIPATVDRADALMGVIQEIKKYTRHAYISYGILSHPAILLREAGIAVERKMSNYKLVKITY